MRDRRGVTRLGVVITVALLTVAAAFGSITTRRARESAGLSRCSNNLRQVAIAALEHADNTRFFPHVRDRGELDGGVETNDTPRVVRGLLWKGYLGTPQLLVCPSSSDAPSEAPPDERFTWAGGRGVEDPLGPRETSDPTLAETRELSYGWTRRSLNVNARSDVPIMADRAVRHDAFRAPEVTPDDPLQGNHVGALVVAQVDGTVRGWSTDERDPERRAVVAGLAAPEGGALAIVDPLRPRAPRVRGRWSHLGADALALVPLGLAGAVFLLARPTAPTTSPGRRARARSGRIAPVVAPLQVQPEQRCPFCHDALAAGDAPVALTSCPDCRAVFHADCVPEDGACTTLGCPARAA